MKYHTFYFSKIKMSQNLLSTAVVIGILRVNKHPDELKMLVTFLGSRNFCHLLTNCTHSLDLEQDLKHAGSDVDSNLMTL